MSLAVSVHDMAAPDDVAGLDAALAGMHGARRVAVLARTAVADDPSRRLARQAILGLFERHGLCGRAALLLSGGCEGIATPCAFLLADDGALEPGGPSRAALGLASRAAGEGEEALMEAVRHATGAALADAGLRQDQAVLVMVKVPAPPGFAAGRRGRALAALAAGAALGEVPGDRAVPASALADPALHSRRVIAFAGADQPEVEALVLGQRPGAGGPLIAASALLAHIADARGLKSLLRGAGLALDAEGEIADPGRVALLMIKGGVAPDGRVLGAPTTLLDATTAPDGPMRAALSGLVGAVLGTTRFHASADPAQAAPPGGAVAALLLQARPA